MKPNAQRATLAITFIAIVMLMDVISMISDFLQYNLLQSVMNGADIPIETLEANDLRQQLIAILSIGVVIISIVTFILWFRRAYYNLHQRVQPLQFSEGWAAGSWFIPFVNLVRPYKIMKELFVETNGLIAHHPDIYAGKLRITFLPLWWGLWIASNIVGQIVFRLSKNMETIEQMSDVTMLSIFSSAIGIPLGFVTIKVIRDYSAVDLMLLEVNENSNDLLPQVQQLAS